MGIKRIGRHLIEHRWRVKRIFPREVLTALERAIKAGEATHYELYEGDYLDRVSSRQIEWFRQYL